MSQETQKVEEKHLLIALQGCGWNIDMEGASLMLKIYSALSIKGGSLTIDEIWDIRDNNHTEWELSRKVPVPA